MSSNFFEMRSEESAVKAQIVDKYYRAWAKIMQSRSERIAYIDLFAGPGRYKDGAASVPLLVLENAISEPKLRDRLVTIFNDKDINNSRTLAAEIDKLPGIEKLRYRPEVNNEIVGENIIKKLTDVSRMPTLSFIDPWGYKGLSLQLINHFIKDWGCDCIFFFNYNRINMGLNNIAVRQHMVALFGEQGIDQLLTELSSLDPEHRELMIVEKISQSLKKMGGRYTLPFCFKNASGSRTSHYLIFVSKHIRGYNIMKEIMGKESSDVPQGVPSFDYCVADKTMPLLFDLTHPLDELEKMLLETFSGMTLKMIDVFERHHVGKRYLRSNYKDALKSLETKGAITVSPPAQNRRRNTFADDVLIEFS